MKEALGRAWPVLAVLATVVALGYPLAFVFGLPLAERDMNDLRKWERAPVTAAPLAEVPDGGTLRFHDPPAEAVPVRDGRPLDVPVTRDGDTVELGDGFEAPAIAWAGEVAREGPRTVRLPDGVDARDPLLTVYVGNELALPGVVGAREVPEGQRVEFTMPGAHGPVLVGARLLTEGEGFTPSATGVGVTLAEAPPFASEVRRISGDYAVLDASEGLLAFAAPPAQEVRVAVDAVRLAERLEGPVDGENRTFTAAGERLVERDDARRLYLNDRLLDGEAGRAEERADGARRTFTFAADRGVVTVDGAPREPERDYTRDGVEVTFTEAPERNAQVRQHVDYLLTDPQTGTFRFATAPDPGDVPWAASYTVHARPSCGTGLFECFLALPQHPVPFPHWIAQRIGPFFDKYPLDDERNALRATAYTALGTAAALLLGGAVGVLLAVAFVLARPVERALLPWVIASQTVPIIALVPVMLLVLGNFGITVQSSLLPTALIGAYIAFFPVVVGTVKGLRSVHPLALELMRSYAASPLQVFLKVRFPAAVPFLFTSLKLGTAAALVGALVAEVESNNRRGLGFQILGQVQSGNVADVWILLLISAGLGIGLVALVGLVQRLVAPWERS